MMISHPPTASPRRNHHAGSAALRRPTLRGGVLPVPRTGQSLGTPSRSLAMDLARAVLRRRRVAAHAARRAHGIAVKGRVSKSVVLMALSPPFGTAEVRLALFR